jgi:hypothetical protein
MKFKMFQAFISAIIILMLASCPAPITVTEPPAEEYYIQVEVDGKVYQATEFVNDSFLMRKTDDYIKKLQKQIRGDYNGPNGVVWVYPGESSPRVAIAGSARLSNHPDYKYVMFQLVSYPEQNAYYYSVILFNDMMIVSQDSLQGNCSVSGSLNIPEINENFILGNQQQILNQSGTVKLKKVKMKILNVIDYQNDVLVQVKPFTSIKSGIDDPVKVTFFQNQKVIAMNKEFKDLYVNNKKVQGIWNEEGTELTYLPEGNFSPMTEYIVSVPLTHKPVQSDLKLMIPGYTIFTTGTSPVAAPINVRASKDSLNYISIDFNPVEEAESYDIYRSASKNGNYEKIGSTDETSYTDWDLLPGETYWYEVKAVNFTSGLESDETDPVEGKTAIPVIHSGDDFVEYTFDENHHYFLEINTVPGYQYEIICDSFSQDSGKYNSDANIMFFEGNTQIWPSYDEDGYLTPYHITAAGDRLYLWINKEGEGNQFAVKVTRL